MRLKKKIQLLENKVAMLQKANTQFITVIGGLKTSDAQHSQLEMTLTLELQSLYLLINNKKTAIANNDPAFE